MTAFPTSQRNISLGVKEDGRAKYLNILQTLNWVLRFYAV